MLLWAASAGYEGAFWITGSTASGSKHPAACGSSRSQAQSRNEEIRG